MQSKWTTLSQLCHNHGVHHYIQGWYSCNLKHPYYHIKNIISTWSLLCKLALRYTHLSTFRIAVDEKPPTTHLRPKALYEMCMCRCQDRPWFRIQNSQIVQSYGIRRSSNIHSMNLSNTAETKDAMAQIGFALGEFVGLNPMDISDWGPHGLACLTLGAFTGSTNSWDVSWQKEKGDESCWKKRWGEWDLSTLWTKRLQKSWWLPPKRCIEFILNGINSMYKLQNRSGLGGFVFQHWLLNPLIFTQSLHTSPLSGLSHLKMDLPKHQPCLNTYSWWFTESGKAPVDMVNLYIYSTSSSYFVKCFTWEPTGDKPVFLHHQLVILSGFPHSKIPNRGSSWHLGAHDHPSHHRLGRSRSRCCFELDKK